MRLSSLRTQFSQAFSRIPSALICSLTVLGSSWGCAGDDSDDAGSHDTGSVAGEGGSGSSTAGTSGSVAGKSGTAGSSVLPSGGADGIGGVDAAGGAGGDSTAPPTRYVISSAVFTEDTSATYLSVLDSLDVPDVDFEQAVEFPGVADIWQHDHHVYVADGEQPTIGRYAVSEDGTLSEQGSVSFLNFGLTSVGFWLNSFVADDKAYLLNGAAELVIWNPKTMEISGTLPGPTLPAHPGLMAYPGYSDRSAPVREGLLYQPYYFTDSTFFEFSPSSYIAVIDIAKDEVVDVIEVPCPGIDFATQDEQGNLFFSSWVFAPGGAAVLDQPATCVAEIAAGSKQAKLAFEVADVTAGRQGGAMRYLGGGASLLSVLHPDHSGATDVEEVAYGANWRFWLYDAKQNSATVVDAIDWNAGAAYDSVLNSQHYLLVPSGDYTSTQLYAVGANGDVAPKLHTRGWSMRLFALDN